MAEEHTAKGLLVVATDAEPSYEAEFNRWHDEEHLWERMSAPGFLSGRGVRCIQGGAKYLALYDLERPDVLETPEYRAIFPPSARRNRSSDHFSVVTRVVHEEITAPIAPGYVESLVAERP